MNRVNVWISILSSVVFVVVLSACGGGGSEGGGGQGVAGTYTGTGTATLVGAGTTQTITGGFTIIIGTDGTVMYQEGGETLATATLNGNQFIVNVPPPPEFSSACSGTIDVNGTVANGQITGTFSSTNMACNGVPFTFTGTFTATKTAKAAVNNLTEAVLSAMKSAL